MKARFIFLVIFAIFIFCFAAFGSTVDKTSGGYLGKKRNLVHSQISPLSEDH